MHNEQLIHEALTNTDLIAERVILKLLPQELPSYLL